MEGWILPRCSEHSLLLLKESSRWLLARAAALPPPPRSHAPSRWVLLPVSQLV